MPDENRDDLRREYAAIVRAVAAFVELEASFGIDSARLPAPAGPARRPPARR